LGIPPDQPDLEITLLAPLHEGHEIMMKMLEMLLRFFTWKKCSRRRRFIHSDYYAAYEELKAKMWNLNLNPKSSFMVLKQ